MTYDVIVGLGSNCAAKSAINVYCDRKIRELKLFACCTNDARGCYPFDWVLISNYDAIIRNLLCDFHGFFEKKSLVLVGHSFGGKLYRSAYDPENEILYNHLFTKPDGLVTTPEVFEAEFEEKADKVRYLLGKFCALRSKRVLYVITGSISVSTASELAHALTIYRGNDDFTLLCFRQSDISVDIGNVSMRHLDCVDFSGFDFEGFGKVIDSEFPLAVFS